jgi:hypothetical protein
MKQLIYQSATGQVLTINTVYTHFTSVNSGSGGRSPQYLSTHSKHSKASGNKSGGNLNKGALSGVPCHFTKSACGRPLDTRFSFSLRLVFVDSSCELLK